MALRGGDQRRLDAQVVEHQLGGFALVARDAARAAAEHEHVLGSLAREELVDGLGVAQIGAGVAVADQIREAGVAQPARERGADQRAAARDEDPRLGVAGTRQEPPRSRNTLGGPFARARSSATYSVSGS